MNFSTGTNLSGRTVKGVVEAVGVKGRVEHGNRGIGTVKG